MIKKSDMKSKVRMFGKAVMKLRERARMGREEFAQRSGLPVIKLAQIENGTASADSFGLNEICKLADGLKVTPYELMKEYETLANKGGAWW